MMHTIVRRCLRGAAIVVALLVLGFGVGTLSSGTAHAQPLSTAAARASVLRVDGLGTATGCAAGDSYCAYCMAYPGTAMCSELQPAMMNGPSIVASKNPSDNSPVMGVEAGGPVLMSATWASGVMTPITLSAITTGLMSPVGVSWQWCSMVGGGSAWVPAGTSSPGLVC